MSGYVYPFNPTFQPAPTQSTFQQPMEVQTKLICYVCEEEIPQGTECINFLYGVAGRGQKSGREMVVETTDIPCGDINLHRECVAHFLWDNLPDIVDEIISIEPEMIERTEIYCQGCGDRIDPENYDD